MTWYYRQQLCLTPTLAGLAFLQVNYFHCEKKVDDIFVIICIKFQIIGIVFSICLIRNIGEEV